MPATTWVAFWVRRSTMTGVALFATAEPLPSCPLVLTPHAHTDPGRRASTKFSPALTWVIPYTARLRAGVVREV